MLALLAPLMACVPGTSQQTQDHASPLLVFAASSLTDVMPELARRFERQHPQVDVRVSFGGSQVLRLQIEQGAPADVFLSANRDHMIALEGLGLIGAGRVFARNELAVIVPRSNPAGLKTLADLPRAELLVLGSQNVPVGIYGRRLLVKAGALYGEGFTEAVTDHIVSEESSVRLVRAKVALGEADAAIVYRSDLWGTPDISSIEIPAALNIVAHYEIGISEGTDFPTIAETWANFLCSGAGQQVLATYGFLGLE
jgi:molybdate transport system substrate-binding protein